ncbi:MAG: ROK family protein [Actinomycetota bacterium]
MREKAISIKEINKKNILKIIINRGHVSRADVSRLLKTSRPTVSTYINELIGEGMVKEAGKSKSSSNGGKRATLLEFNSRAGYILGAMIGVKSIRIAVTDLLSNVIEIMKVPTEEWLGPQPVIDKIVEGSEKIMEKALLGSQNVLGIGIGAPGLVDCKKGIVTFSPNLAGWSDIDLKKAVEQKIGFPTYIDNECRVQAIAEKLYGMAKGVKNFVCIETGVGIGSGVFINDRLFGGDKGMAGEIGHITTNLGGNKLCHCGNAGCLETLCSVTALIDNINKDMKGTKISLDELYKLYRENNEIVTRRVEENARYLGIGISNAIKMFNPELVIIHGEAIKFGEKYLNIVRKTVTENTFPKVKDSYNIQFSRLGEKVGLIGATSVVFEKTLNLNSLGVSGEYLVKKTL